MQVLFAQNLKFHSFVTYLSLISNAMASRGSSCNVSAAFHALRNACFTVSGDKSKFVKKFACERPPRYAGSLEGMRKYFSTSAILKFSRKVPWKRRKCFFRR